MSGSDPVDVTPEPIVREDAEPAPSAPGRAEASGASTGGSGDGSSGGAEAGSGGDGPTGAVAVVRDAFGRIQSLGVIVATLVLVFGVGAFHPDFLQGSQLFDILQQSTYVGLIAGGMAYLIAMREIDLSVGSMFGLCLIIDALLITHGWDPWLASGAVIVLGGVLGAINASLVGLLSIPTIVATLATLSVYRGLAIGMSNGDQVIGLPVENKFFTILGGYAGPIPVSVLVTLAILIPLALYLHRTPFGARVRACGSNPSAAVLSGISITRTRTQVLILVGVLSGISGVLGLAFFTSGDPNIGTGFELQAIAAAVIGGTPLRGGTGSVVGAVVGAVLLNVVASALSYFSIPANWSAFATGAAILLAVGLDSLVRRRRSRVSNPGSVA